MSNAFSGVMSALSAEELLKDSRLFDEIKTLQQNIAYTSEEGKASFDDYFKKLTDEVNAIPKLQLEDDVAPGTETTYTIQLTQACENIVDECDRVYRRLNQFEGKLREAERAVKNQKASFVAWYMLAASALLKDLDDIKLPQTKIADLANAEYSRLIGGLDVTLETLLEAVKIETNRVAQHKSTQKEKYNLGKDQANASWTSSLPAFGNAFTEDRGDVSGVQEMDEEDVPAPMKTKPQISIADTLRIIRPEEKLVKGAQKCVCDSNEVYGGHRDNCPQSQNYKEPKKVQSARRKLIEEED